MTGGIGTRAALALGLAVLVANLACGATPARAAESSLWKAIRVVYVAGGSVYLDAGTADGLAVGDSLVVRRLGSEIALLQVSDISSRRSACDTLLTRTTVQVGDEARRIGVPRAGGAQPADSSLAALPADSTRATPRAPGAPVVIRQPARAWLRGRAGARWLSASAGSAVRVQQPMLDLSLAGGDDSTSTRAILDVRGRRTVRTSSEGLSSHDSEARVYRASLAFQRDGDRARFEAGRVASPSLAAVSLFDGALAETGTRGWRAGVFGGTQPDPDRMRWSGAISEFGAYLSTRSRPASSRRWQAGAGAVSSYDHGRSNRDFLFGQGFYQDGRLTGSWLQEADVVRPWKRIAGEPGFSFTSTFLTAQVRVVPRVTVQAGYDGRRSVRLYRDRITPETEFDDRYRQGTWAGAITRLPYGFTLAADQRWNRGSGENATVSDGSAELRARSRFAPALRGRWSEYRSPLSRTELAVASFGLQPFPSAYVETSGGQRRTRVTGSASDPPVTWWGASTDLTLGRRWFADFSWESSRSSLDHTSQVYAGLSRRLP